MRRLACWLSPAALVERRVGLRFVGTVGNARVYSNREVVSKTHDRIEFAGGSYVTRTNLVAIGSGKIVKVGAGAHARVS